MDSERAFTDDIRQIVDESWLKTKAWMVADLASLYSLGARYVRKASKVNIDLTTINFEAIRWVNSLKWLSGTNNIESIPSTTVKEVTRIVSDGIFDGNTYKEIANEILSKTKA
jgi:hypothetical protein